MKNILQEVPLEFEQLHGRTRACCSFVNPSDLAERRVLDIGCGFGWFELFALRQGLSEITGIELSERDLAAARQAIRDSRARLRQGNALELEFPDQSLDTVVAWDVIEHLPSGSEERFFNQVQRVLAPGGVFYLSTPYASLVARLSDPAWWLIGHRHYSRERLAALGLGAGLRVHNIHRAGGWWDLVGLLDLYFAKWVFRRRPFAERVIDRHTDQEYAWPDGFMTIFASYRKPE